MLLTTLAFAQGIANVMNNLNYQIVGIMVVMMCLGGLAVILTISGSIAAAIQNRAKAKTAAPVAAPAAAPAAAGKPGMTPEAIPGLRLCGRRQGGNLRLPPHSAFPLNYSIIHPYPRPGGNHLT